MMNHDNIKQDLISMADELNQTGEFWSNIIKKSSWHFDPSYREKLIVSHINIAHVQDILIEIADQGIEKTIQTSLQHATISDDVSEKIKNNIQELATQCGYPMNLVYSLVHDLFQTEHWYAGEIAAQLSLQECYRFSQNYVQS